ncbi:unnamed protein product [Tuber melanosporum]|uniref:(Perigord truffle) hypothetical protein n=1 Tax=Tuber melanosporum (strain Mel28) TaxID=656061 RepID=D5GJ63_TUBMM|nr:uncharacterized protein GSTUM_00008858001 [Tuber melanosporum]CAZ84556.1 unnamed protein product [Tuber melanosporum]
MSTTLPVIPSPSPTQTGNGGGNNGPTSSPLLFFVALGFGVVFTNLWIIVGVKYCFRYNARQRRRANGEEEPVDLQTMPRPHRRRREKKLMTMDEVNERFPTTKYKSWRAHRERMGLPTEGGIKTAPNSRPASLMDLEAATSADANNGSPDALAKELTLPPAVDKETSPAPAPTLFTDKLEAPEIARKHLSDISEPEVRKCEDDEDEEDEHDHVQTAVPDELLNSVGDSCAICLDTIEDDDDIRGLTCGHAFHAGCLDPWLTSRKACCPLCKADYYVPKPRPEGENVPDDQSRSHRHRRGTNGTPTPPANVYLVPRRMLFSPRRIISPYYTGSASGRSRGGSSVAAQRGSEDGQYTGGSRWMRNPLRGVSLSFGRRNNTAAPPTPSNLEAGLLDNTPAAAAPSTGVPTPNPISGAEAR